MLLAHHRSLVDRLRQPTATEPWRVLVSGCLAGWTCGVDGTDNGLGGVLARLFALPTVRVSAFCPEQHSLGTPRTMPDIHGGDGVDVLALRAKVLDERGEDLSAKMIEGARAMLAFAQQTGSELAILTDMSAACGTQVISDGCRFDAVRRYRKGVGVAAALLLEAGLPVVASAITTRSRCSMRGSTRTTRHRPTRAIITSTRGRSRTCRVPTRAHDLGARPHRSTLSKAGYCETATGPRPAHLRVWTPEGADRLVTQLDDGC